jgi:hypothetical protein
MKTLKMILLNIAIMSLAIPSLAVEMGISGGHDLDQLWTLAQADRDLAAEDAVLLLESHQVTLDADGTLATRVHRVVWIGSSVGIRSYADLRVPWNTATSELDVEILRTWRDGRWWPGPETISETAVVHTLPYAVNRADDYTTIRETMLLHDGVELPCIMETAYTITETGLSGADGLFVMPRRDFSALTELQVTVPAATELHHEMLNGVPEPVVKESGGAVTTTWRMNEVAPLLIPLTDAPAAYEPAVVWSTWSEWTALRDHWRMVFDEAAVLDEALTDSLQTWIEHAPSHWSRLQAVTDQVNQYVRGVHYPDRFWTFNPRAAVRTWDTAYGHRLDRAVLTAALLRAAGYEVTPIFVGTGHSLVGPEIARLDGMGDLHLSIKGDPAGLYDPDRGSLSGQAPLIGLPIWRTDQFFEPFLGNSQWPNRLEVTVTLEPGDDGHWLGSGQFRAAGIFCPQGDMAGMDDGAHDYLTGVVGGMIDGASLDRTNPEIFHQHQVIFGFGVDVEKPEPEASGRIRLVVGAPGHGLASRVDGIHLSENVRKSPVMMAGPVEQLVKVRLKVGEAEAAHFPEPVSLVNEAGTFTVTSTKKDGWITVERELKLTADSYPAEMWPQLRDLLLEDADPANGVILLDCISK